MLRPGILPAILILLPASSLPTAQASLGEAPAEQCRTRPAPSAPRGTHWYYRVNRKDNRHCWYLSSEGFKRHSRRGAVLSHPIQHPPQRQERSSEIAPAISPHTIPAQTASAPTVRAAAPEHIAGMGICCALAAFPAIGGFKLA